MPSSIFSHFSPQTLFNFDSIGESSLPHGVCCCRIGGGLKVLTLLSVGALNKKRVLFISVQE